LLAAFSCLAFGVYRTPLGEKWKVTRDARKVTSFAEAEQFAAKYGLEKVSFLIMDRKNTIAFLRSNRSLFFNQRIVALWEFDETGRVVDSIFSHTTKLDLDGTRRQVNEFLLGRRAQSGQ
jgi:hypothetical protein